MNAQDVIREVYDESNKALKTTGSFSASLGGNVTLNGSPNFIGIVTVANPGSANLTGNVTLNPSPNFIGIVTVANPSSAALSGNVTLDAGSKTGIVGNVTLTDAKTYVGLTTSTLGVGTQFIGLATVVQASSVRSIVGNVTLTDAKTYVGLTTTTLGAGSQYIGFATVIVANDALGAVLGKVYITDPTNSNRVNVDAAQTMYVNQRGNVTLSDAKTYVGLVTASAINNGTSKTILTIPVGFSSSSIATIAVPTNANRIFLTSMVLNSNATARVTFKSGVTYMTGNASIGVTLSPTGGFILPGSPDSPSWIGLPSGAFVIEKLDLTATAAGIAGHINYFQEA